MHKTKFTISRDTREHPGHGFHFRASKACSGMTVATLRTGDYSIRGLEEVVCIERKESISEFASNLTQPRFDRELNRMDDYKVAVVLLEFGVEDLLDWPRSSDLPPSKRKQVRAKGPFLLKRLAELMAKHPNVQFLFVGNRGQEVALAILKQAWVDHAPSLPAPVDDSPTLEDFLLAGRP